MFRRPPWYYGILCLIAAVLPTMVTDPPADPAQKAARFNSMVLFSAIGFALILVSAYRNWRRGPGA